MTFTTGSITFLMPLYWLLYLKKMMEPMVIKITQDVQNVLEISESTLYPVLRRLQKNEYLDTYDRQYDGRNRRYYKITSQGEKQLEYYREEWKHYSDRISQCLKGELGV